MKLKAGVAASATSVAHQERLPRDEEWGRKAILSGFLLATIGMVCFCYVTLGDGLEADAYKSLFENGILGWGALLLLLMGVGVWFAGNFVVLKEADRAEADTETSGTLS
jgi:hypothetical protein